MSTMQNYADSIGAYALALFAMVTSHSTDIMGILGFVLLMAKLVQEVPKAWNTVFGKKTKDVESIE